MRFRIPKMNAGSISATFQIVLTRWSWLDEGVTQMWPLMT